MKVAAPEGRNNLAIVSLFRRSAAVFLINGHYPRLTPWATYLPPLRGSFLTTFIFRGAAFAPKALNQRQL